MGGVAFVASIAHALAWPLAVVVVVFSLRRGLGNLNQSTVVARAAWREASVDLDEEQAILRWAAHEQVEDKFRRIEDERRERDRVTDQELGALGMVDGVAQKARWSGLSVDANDWRVMMVVVMAGYVCSECGEALPADTPCPCSMEDESDFLTPDWPASRADREAPTLPALLSRVAELPADAAARVLARVRPLPVRPQPDSGERDVPPPQFTSWADFSRPDDSERETALVRREGQESQSRTADVRPS
jgi:hypothetical protein